MLIPAAFYGNVNTQAQQSSKGNATNNKRLSLLRANTIRDALCAKGIDPGRLTCIGHGQEKPLAPNDNATNRALNRRVELIRTDAAEEQ